MNALVLEQFADVDDCRARLRKEGGEALGVALVGEALIGSSGIGWIAPRLLEQQL